MLEREFEYPEKSSKSCDFTILQWNILADALCDPKSFPRCPSEYLTWEYRKPMLLQGIRLYLPDVICLEEVDNTINSRN